MLRRDRAIGRPSDAERLESAVATDDGSYRLEFWDSSSILAALIACKGGFEVVEPRWLRSRLHRRLDALPRVHAPR